MTDPGLLIQPTTRGLLRRLGTNSGIYAIGNALARGAPLLLVPIFTRVLTPGDYGVIAIATAVASLLGLVLSFSLESAITVLYFQYFSDKERAELYASLLFCWLVGSGAITIGLDLAGSAGYLSFVPGVPFVPYLRTVLWTSYFTIFITALQTLYLTQQRTTAAVTLGLVQMLITVSASLYLVVVRRLGAEGSLMANLIAAISVGAFSLYRFGVISKHRPSWNVLLCALGFSLPLVPHVASSWVLNLSDRAILKRFVSSADVGVYSLGYQVASLVTLGTQGINSAFFPFFNAEIASNDGRTRIAVLGTYAILATAVLGVGVALLGGDLIRAITPPSYHGATRVVPWVAVGCIFQGVYFISSRGTWYSMKTGWVPVITGIAAGLNFGLNLLLIPRFGYMAAAVNTTVAFAVMAILHGSLAHKVFPVAWEYSRWAKVGVAAGATLLLGLSVPIHSLMWSALARTAILVIGFPFALWILKFITIGEWSAVRKQLAARAA